MSTVTIKRRYRQGYDLTESDGKTIKRSSRFRRGFKPGLPPAWKVEQGSRWVEVSPEEAERLEAIFQSHFNP